VRIHQAQSLLHSQLQQHDQCLTAQIQCDVSGLLAYYVPDAVIADPLFSQLFAGIVAITKRFIVEVVRAPKRSFAVMNPALVGGPLVVEWLAIGTHESPFLDVRGNGQQYTTCAA